MYNKLGIISEKFDQMYYKLGIILEKLIDVHCTTS